MPDLQFQITGSRALSEGMTPMMGFDLEIVNPMLEEPVQSIFLHVQTRIESTRRRYSEVERGRLTELFGAPKDWGRTMQDMLWDYDGVVAPAFKERTVVELTIPCTFDLNVASAKYFYGLEGGDVPLIFLFSGTVFYTTDGKIQIQRISWEKECRHRLPVERWVELMNHHYPELAWMYLDREVFDRLYAYRQRAGLTSWDAAVSQLLAEAEQSEVAA